MGTRSRVLQRITASALAVIVLGGMFVESESAPAEAIYATGGSGLYKGSIDWFDWAPKDTVIGYNDQTTPPGTVTRTNTRTIGGSTLITTCTLSNMHGQTATYRSGQWGGDALDNLYNIGGANAANTMVTGLYNYRDGNNSNGGELIQFDFDCNVTLDGMPVPVKGMVVGDAEASNSGTTGRTNYVEEWIRVKPATPATWRVVDRLRTGCTRYTIGDLWADNTLRLRNSGQECANPTTGVGGNGPVAVAFMEGATAGKATIVGRGKSAMALGIVLDNDFGDAPESYGAAGALIDRGWTGGEIPKGQYPYPHSQTTGLWKCTQTSGIFCSWNGYRETDANGAETMYSYQQSYTAAQTPPASTNLFDNFAMAVPGNPDLMLGARIDAEPVQPFSPDARGDDTNATSDDEEAITAVPDAIAFPGAAYSVTVACTGTGYVSGWLDWNRNGAFDSGEMSSVVSCAGGQASLSWTTPADVVKGASFLRLRIAPNASNLTPTGMVYGGEVEDHPVVIRPALTIDKSSSATTSSRVGDVVTYTVKLKNISSSNFTAALPASFTDDLGNVLDDANWNNDAAVAFDMGSTGTPPTLTGTMLNWSGPLKAGETATFTYSVTLKAGGNGTVTNTACITTDDCDSTTTALPKLTIDKSVNSTQPPSTFWDTDYTYTVVVRNNGPGAATAQNPASVEDDLSDVLDDATFTGINSTVLSSPSGSTPAATFDAATKKLKWSGPLAVGQQVTITYTVKYMRNMTGNRELYNRACIPANLAQDPAARCDEVTIPPNAGTIQSWKSSDPPSGTVLAAGDTVTYTLHFKNNETSIWGRTVDHEDVLAEVLDDADVISAPTASNPALTVTPIANGRFKVTGTVPAATTYTVSYTVRVKADGQRGNSRLDNFVVPTGTNPPGTCVPTGSQHPSCTTHPVLGSVIWGKTGAQSERIGGSEWTITGPSGSASQTVTVIDCEAANAAGCAGADKDPRAGYLEVTQLAWGDYTLVETKAPLGYVLDPTPRSFTIGGGAAQQRVDLGGIVNERQTALIIPLTGGLGADWFLFGGGGTLAALLALISIRAHRRNRAFAGPGRP